MAASSDRQGGRGRGTQQGYEATFNPPLDRKYVCPICLAALREAVQTTCGHRFCSDCMDTLVNGEAYMKCPVDNILLCPETEIFPDVAVRREVLSLFVRCENHTHGCLWTGELRELQCHVAACSYILTPCTNNCGEMVSTDSMMEHLEVCPRRLVVCQHCQTHVFFSDMTKHQVLICEKFPVKCTLCGKMGINREDIPKHVDSDTGDCPQAMVLCKYSSVGCTVKVTRQKLPSHYEEEVDNHLHLLETKHSGLQQLILTLEQKVETLSEEHQRRWIVNSSCLLEQMELLLVALRSVQPMGSLYWRLEIPEDGERRFESTSFFTGFPGYKLKVSLDLEGSVDSEEGVTYTSFGIELQQGEFDNNLVFPLNGLCRVILFNHSESAISLNHHTMSFNCADLERCYEGRRSVHTRRFLPKNTLLSFCKNGTLYCGVTFTHPEQTNWQEV